LSDKIHIIIMQYCNSKQERSL